MNKYKILCIQPNLHKDCKNLINFTKCIDMVSSIDATYTSPYLVLDDTGLSIKCAEFNPIYVREIYSALDKRIKMLDKELLIHAIKIKKTEGKISHVLDLTAGLAKDSLLIAKYGYTVTMVEQNPLLATIIYYAIQNSYLPSNTSIIFMNSIHYINQLTKDKHPEIVYLDPMFKQNKSAKAKKEMQLIQLITDNEKNNRNDTLLFKVAYKIATNKVVVKRDNKQAPIVQKPAPSYNKCGKTVRYDVYTRIT